ncbi:MAG: UbiX family flavin prenyltransferase [Halioglobus sp.]|nr:UbiX family flavin prenyltransferase [Halioglobus sp.]
MKKKIIVGLSGASGIIYGIRALEHLQRHDQVETHLVMSGGARTNIAIETDYKPDDVKALADVVHRNDNLAASIASGSFRTDGMLVAPCSMKTLSGIANSYADNLLVRAADVVLKEQRKLALMVRETPLHKGHLELMMRVVDYGALLYPPMPAFYHDPQTIDDIIDQNLGKVFDYFGIEHNLFRRWGDGRSAGNQE